MCVLPAKKEALDAFAATLVRIYKEAQENPELMQKTPHHMPVKRVDEVKAAREMKLKHTSESLYETSR